LVLFQVPPYLKNKNEATAAKKKNLQNIWNEKKWNIFPTAHKLLSLLVNSCSLHILLEGVSLLSSSIPQSFLLTVWVTATSKHKTSWLIYKH